MSFKIFFQSTFFLFLCVANAGIANAQFENFSGPPKLNVSSINFEFVNRGFSADTYLNLAAERTYQFDLHPNTVYWEGSALKEIPIPDGSYRLRISLNANDSGETPDWFESKEVTWKAAFGKLSGRVSFSFRDLRLVQSRSTIRFEFLDSRFQGVFEGIFVPEKGGSILVEPLEQSYPPRKVDNQVPVTNPIELMVQQLGTLPLDSEIKAQAFINQKETFFDSDAKARKAAIAKLCSLYFDSGWFTSLSGCEKNPQKYLTFTYTRHLILPYKSEVAHVDISNLAFSANLNFSWSVSNETSEGTGSQISTKFDLGMGVPILKDLGLNLGMSVGYGKNWFSSQSVSKKAASGTTNATTLTKSFFVEELRFKIEGLVEQCLWVKDKGTSDNKRSYHLCATPMRETSFENYYYIYQHSFNGVIVDSSGKPTDKPVSTLIRGKNAFKEFLVYAGDSSVEFNLSEGLPTTAKLLHDLSNSNDGLFPGLLSENSISGRMNLYPEINEQKSLRDLIHEAHMDLK